MNRRAYKRITLNSARVTIVTCPQSQSGCEVRDLTLDLRCPVSQSRIEVRSVLCGACFNMQKCICGFVVQRGFDRLFVKHTLIWVVPCEIRNPELPRKMNFVRIFGVKYLKHIILLQFCHRNNIFRPKSGFRIYKEPRSYIAISKLARDPPTCTHKTHKQTPMRSPNPPNRRLHDASTQTLSQAS